MKKKFLILAGFVLICQVYFSSCSQGDNHHYKPVSSLEKYRALRTEKLNKPRPVIHNNDGEDVNSFPLNEKYSVSNLLSKRTAGLAGTGVTTVSYCPNASGFGYFTFPTTVGEVLTNQGFNFEIQEEVRNITAEMIAEGTDPLQVNIDFARKNGLEFFWSNRMNDTHDAAHRDDNPSLYWTKFKENNPQWLFGTTGERLPNGRWSSVDFSQQAVRDLCVRFYREVCDNYDVDGVELDFLRHFEIFKTVGRGGVASQEQLDMLTDMVRQIRKATEEAGMKRGNPILVLTRIPTSPEYAKRAGVDIRRWIEEGLVDIVAGSCYFRLDFWENFAKLGEGKPVKIYAGLSESRVLNEHPALVRQQNAVFRARAAAAWQAGIDGIYSFNEYNTRVKYLCEIDCPDKLKKTNNLYFVTYRDYDAERYLQGGDDFFKMPRLSPSRCKRKFEADPFDFKIELGNEKEHADVYAILYAENITPDDLTVKLNGIIATFLKTSDDGLFIYKISKNAVKPGINNFYIKGTVKDDSRILKDAALFFCRDTADFEMRKLISLCQ